jgi:hypothetical protein
LSPRSLSFSPLSCNRCRRQTLMTSPGVPFGERPWPCQSLMSSDVTLRLASLGVSRPLLASPVVLHRRLQNEPRGNRTELLIVQRSWFPEEGFQERCWWRWHFQARHVERRLQINGVSAKLRSRAVTLCPTWRPRTAASRNGIQCPHSRSRGQSLAKSNRAFSLEGSA